MRHNLIDLRITQGMYPDDALADLHALKVLKIDCMRGEYFQMYIECITDNCTPPCAQLWIIDTF